MEANEAPEKIYVHRSKHIKRLCASTAQGLNDIEYIRKDAFLDKAAIWFNNNFIVHDEFSVMSDSFNTTEEMYEDFVKYIKGD